jgi:DNA primase
MTAEYIKQNVTMPDILTRYGFGLGRRNRIPCPIHNGRDDNFVYDDGHFKCFVCGESGTVNDFAMALYKISFPQAVVRIASDFGISCAVPDNRQIEKMRAEREKAEAERITYQLEYDERTRLFSELWRDRKRYAPATEDEMTPEFAACLRRLTDLEIYFETHPLRPYRR